MPLIRKTPETTQAAQAPAESVAALSSASADERWAAARSAAEDPAGVAALAAALAREQDARVREAIFTALSRIATLQSAQALLPSLHSDNAQLRTGALDALRAMPDAARLCLPQLLADRDADVRLLACDLVRDMADDDSTSLLCGIVEREREANVCAAAVEVLADIGDTRALPVLAHCGARFAADPFLPFAIEVACDRIRARDGESA